MSESPSIPNSVSEAEFEIHAKHPLAIRWFHWLNFPLLSVMIWSGLLIYWANDVYKIQWNGKVLFKFFPDGVYDKLHLGGQLAAGMAWHFAVMWLFLVNGLLYVVYTIFSGEWRELVPGRGAFKESIQVVLHDLRIRKEPLPDKKFNAAQQFAYTGIIVMGIGSVFTGIAIYKPVQFSLVTALCGGYESARLIHFILTLGYVAFFFIHVAQVVKAGWNNFRAMVTGYEVREQRAK